MSITSRFKLEKLKIHSYDKPEREGVHKTFQVMYNPESYSLRYQNVYGQKQGINTSGRSALYAMTVPSRLSLTIILDGTNVQTIGLSLFEGRLDVYRSVQRFLDYTYDMDGELHEPRYLTISWGDLTFKCRLESVDVKYTLFDNHGIPLRAELQTEFFGDIVRSERLQGVNKSSPDLTHSRTVRSHDLLPMMCEVIYNSPHYYIQVAKANKLLDFRNLEPGQEIFFPPIEKGG